ncbi:MAG: WecB/TagA/CpsF family glycosyltransferase [Acidimicrobiia bacterium]
MKPRDEPVHRITLGGVAVDLAERADVLRAVRDRLVDPDQPVLLIASANLQHLGLYRPDGPSERSFERSRHEWLVLIDGAPLARQARRLTGRAWPRLAGSDLLPDLLDVAGDTGASVAFVGGAPDRGERLAEVCARRWPGLRFAGQWSPARAELGNHDAMSGIADEMQAAGTDLVVAGLPKPTSEQWLDAWVDAAGARVGLAFGAAPEFLTGDQTRAPDWVSRTGTEWLWRLAHDPKRLARRYLIEGPGEYLRLRRDSHL